MKTYFAYGANLSKQAMALRCPAAEVVGPAALDGFRLVMRGCMDIEEALEGLVQGALWRITPACEAALDAYEFYPTVYDKRFVSVRTERSVVEGVLVYQMVGEPTFTPADPAAYARTIRDGYDDFGLDPAPLEAALARTDSDGS